MSESELVEREFARFEADFAGTFRPPPVSALRPRRRGRAKVWLAGLSALLVAAAGGFAVNAVGQDTVPPPPPTPAPTPAHTSTPARAPGITLVDRPVHLAGASGDLLSLSFSDAEHGWVLYVNCEPPSGQCQYHLGKTADAGRTWQRVTPPPLSGTPGGMITVDQREMIVFGVGGENWYTGDAGATFRRAPYGGDDQLRAVARPPQVPFKVADGRLVLLATGATGALPGGAGALHVLAQGGTGPLWAGAGGDGTWRLFRSDDGAATWHMLPEPVPAGGALKVSPDGRDAWYIHRQKSGAAELWRLTPTGAVAQAGPPGVDTVYGVEAVEALGGGRLVFVDDAGAKVWKDGVSTRLDTGLTGDPRSLRHVQVLADGAMLAQGEFTGTTLSADGGVTWIRY